MKAVHLYIGVLIGCSVLVGIAVSVDRRITEATLTLRALTDSVAAIQRTSSEQSKDIQALRLDLQGVKFEANNYMDYQDQIHRPARRTPRLSAPGESIK